MKIQLLSDLHLEFYKKDLDRKWIENLDTSEADILILAGDICSSPQLYEALSIFLNIHDLPIVFVAGNHEYYDGSWRKTHSTLLSLQEKYQNFIWINNEAKEVLGQRFIGGTLWYPDTFEAILKLKRWSDNQEILDPRTVIFEQAKRCKMFLEKNLKPSDIVVTHMLPSMACVAEKFRNSPNNCFFVHDCEKLILDVQPKIWCFGHTHHSVDFYIDKTRIIANPKGYPMNTPSGYENETFESNLIIEI